MRPKDPQYVPGKTVIVGAHVHSELLTSPDLMFKMAKAIASGKPRMINLMLYGNRYVGDDTFGMLKSYLKPMGIDFDWFHDLQNTLGTADKESDNAG